METIKTVIGYAEKIESRPKLNFDEQIQYLKNSKGIKFNIISEDEAKLFLQNNNYFFKIKAYGKNYSINTNKSSENYGKYNDLEFAYLKELSTIDMFLREKILKLALNIEHFLKIQLLKDVTENNAEDGYNIVKKFSRNIRPDLLNGIKEKSANSYCKDLIEHRINNFAVWDLIEVISFGEFVDLYTYYYSMNKCSTKCMSNNLKSVQWLRNAAAHNNCIINHLSPEYSIDSLNREVCDYISKNIKNISAKNRLKKMSNKPVHDFVVMLYVFDNVVTSEKIKYHTLKELKEIFDDRLLHHKDYFQKNALIQSNYEFVKKIIDYYFSLCNNI